MIVLTSRLLLVRIPLHIHTWIVKPIVNISSPVMSSNNFRFQKQRCQLSSSPNTPQWGSGGNQHKYFSTGSSAPPSQSQKQKEEFEFFFGPANTFSQMHRAFFKVEGVQFNCMEQYMQWKKAVTFGDERTAKMIMSSSDPKEHKKLGRKVTPFNAPNWGSISVEVVKQGNIQKFSQNPKMKEILFATYPKTLVEASPRDRLWGIGLGKDNPKARDKRLWRGQNLLGYTLTEVRDTLMTLEGKIPSVSSNTASIAGNAKASSKESRSKNRQFETAAHHKHHNKLQSGQDRNFADYTQRITKDFGHRSKSTSKSQRNSKQPYEGRDPSQRYYRGYEKDRSKEHQRVDEKDRKDKLKNNHGGDLDEKNQRERSKEEQTRHKKDNDKECSHDKKGEKEKSDRKSRDISSIKNVDVQQQRDDSEQYSLKKDGKSDDQTSAAEKSSKGAKRKLDEWKGGSDEYVSVEHTPGKRSKTEKDQHNSEKKKKIKFRIDPQVASTSTWRVKEQHGKTASKQEEAARNNCNEEVNQRYSPDAKPTGELKCTLEASKNVTKEKKLFEEIQSYGALTSKDVAQEKGLLEGIQNDVAITCMDSADEKGLLEGIQNDGTHASMDVTDKRESTSNEAQVRQDMDDQRDLSKGSYNNKKNNHS